MCWELLKLWAHLRLSLGKGEGRVRVAVRNRTVTETPHLIPLPFPKGERRINAEQHTTWQFSLYKAENIFPAENFPKGPRGPSSGLALFL
jgi:hypothetical protein